MRFLIMILLAVGLASCSDGGKNIKGSEYIIEDSLLVWEANSDSMIMKRDSTIPDSAITITRIINGLNQKYPEVPIVFVKQYGDTIFTKVTDGQYLGNQMGSAGASGWYDDAVINLTSIPGVNYISFDIGMFSHANSAVIGKGAYQNWKQQ
jgi:hypothetical protein